MNITVLVLFALIYILSTFILTEIFAYKEDIAVLPADIAGRGVDVGVVGLLQSVDG